MEVRVIAFGKIADIAGAQQWTMQEVKTTEELRRQLEQTYPGLQDMRYLIALDKKIVQGNTVLSNRAEVALLPPFSGG